METKPLKSHFFLCPAMCDASTKTQLSAQCLCASAVTVQMLWTCTMAQRQQRLCAGFMFHTSSTRVFKHAPTSSFWLKPGTRTMTYPLFDVSVATPSCPTVTIPSHITKTWSTKAKEAWTCYFTQMCWNFHITECTSTALPTAFLYD